MEAIPLELKENPLKLEVVIDSETKCVTMKTLTESTPTLTTNPVHTIIPKDPLQKEDVMEPDFHKMTELDKLIYSERQRLLQIKPTKQFPHTRVAVVNPELTQNEKSRIRMRKKRAHETEEQRESRKFRARIAMMKIRLLQRLKNFDNESYLEDIKKSVREKIRQQRLEQKLKETPEEREERRSKMNNMSRLAKQRRKIFKTPEELEKDRQTRMAALKKRWASKTPEERRAEGKKYRERTKERYRKVNQERKKFDHILQGKSIEEVEAMDDDVIFKKGPIERK